VIDALPLILKEQGVRGYGQLFVPGTKQDMVMRYAKDENGAYVPKRQKRFKELEQALEEEEEYDEVQMGYLEALPEEQTTLSEDNKRNVISGMELLMQDNNAYNTNEEASLASISTLGTLKALSNNSNNSENTPPTRNTEKLIPNSPSSSNSGSTIFSVDTMATLQATTDPTTLAPEEEEDYFNQPTNLETRMIASMSHSMKGMEVDSGQEDTPLKKPPNKSTSQLLHQDTGDPSIIDLSSEDESEEDKTDVQIQQLSELNANMTWEGEESTWPSQFSHHKCHQLLQYPALLQKFLQEWLTTVAFPIDMDPSDTPEYSYTERMIKRVINDLKSTEELPMEALVNLLEWTSLSQIEAKYGLHYKSQINSGTTGPSNERGTGGEW
jgi:hypothetical protein